MASTGDRRLRLAVVGCGDIAESAHLPAIARSADVELAGVVDVDATARDRLAALHRVPAAATVAEAMAWRLDAAVVATPPEVTPRLTLDLLGRGLHVLCEKPMAADLDAAREVHAAAAASPCVVQVGFVNRFSPLIERVREWIDDGRLGRPLVFSLSTHDERYDPADEVHARRIAHFLRHGAAFAHEAAHQTDYVLHLGGGTPVEVDAAGMRTDASFASDNYTTALVRFDNGDLARFEVAWMYPALAPNDFRVLGPLGLARVHRAEGWATLTSAAGEERVELDRPWVDVTFDGQLAAFVASVRTGVPLGPGTADGLASIELCRRVVAASSEGTAAPRGVGEAECEQEAADRG